MLSLIDAGGATDPLVVLLRKPVSGNNTSNPPLTSTDQLSQDRDREEQRSSRVDERGKTEQKVIDCLCLEPLQQQQVHVTHF